MWPNHGLQGKLEIVSDSRKKHTNWQEKAIGLRIGSNLKFSKGGPKGLIKKGTIEYESKLAGNIKTDCKSFYRYVKRKRLTKTNVRNGGIQKGNKEMAKKLNLYFASGFTEENMNKVPEVLENTSFSEDLN